MIRNLCRVNSTVILQGLGARAVHAMMDVLTERVPFSRDFLFRQVTRAKRHACAETQYAALTLSTSSDGRSLALTLALSPCALM